MAGPTRSATAQQSTPARNLVYRDLLGRILARFRGHHHQFPNQSVPGFQIHHDPSLDGPWHWAQLGVLLLPFSPVLGGIAWLVALVWTTRLWGDRWGRDRLYQGGLILAVGMMISASLAAYPGMAWLGLANFLPCFWFFAAVRTFVQSPRQLRHLAQLQVYSAVPIVILGLLALGGLLSGPVNLSVVVQWPLEAGGTPAGRMAAVFAYANVLASYLVVTLGLGLGLGLEAWQRRFFKQSPTKSPTKSQTQSQGRSLQQSQTQSQQKSQTQPQETSQTQSPEPQPDPTQATNPDRPQPPPPKPLNGFLLGGAIALQSIGLLLTHSRNAWGVGLLLGLATAVRLRWFWLLWSAVGAVAAVFWAAFGSVGQGVLQQLVPRFIWARLNDELYGDRPPAELRTSQWQFAWDLTQQRPWTGWGLRNFTPLYETATGFWLGHPHNFFLMLSAEVGLPLTLGFMGFVGWILAQGVMQGRSGLHTTTPRTQTFDPDRAILLTYLLTFGGCILFNCLDVTFFDYRINLTNWLLLGAIAGVSNPYSQTGDKKEGE